MRISLILEITPSEMMALLKLHSEPLINMGQSRNGDELYTQYIEILGTERAEQVFDALHRGHHVKVKLKSQ